MESEKKKNKKPLKWSPAIPVKRQDYIKSSVFAERGESGFTPSYEKGPINLNCLLSYEYFRMWFKERDQYIRDTYTKQDKKNKEAFVKRRFVQRYIHHVDKKKIIPVIQIKKFQNIPAKESNTREGVKLREDSKQKKIIQSQEEEKRKQYIRYRPECLKTHEKGEAK